MSLVWVQYSSGLSASKPYDSLLQLSWLVFSTGNRKCALAWRRHDAVCLIHLLLSKAEQKSSSCWDLFWPWADPSRTQTNFLVDNKHFLSQKALQLRGERHETRPQYSSICYMGCSTCIILYILLQSAFTPLGVVIPAILDQKSIL